MTFPDRGVAIWTAAICAASIVSSSSLGLMPLTIDSIKPLPPGSRKSASLISGHAWAGAGPSAKAKNRQKLHRFQGQDRLLTTGV